jgi:cell division protein FtsQ
VNEGEPKRDVFCWVVIIGGVLIAAAAIALYAPCLYLFDLRDIEVDGNHYISTEEIEYVAGFSIGENLLTAPIDRARTVLSSLPWVKDISIKRLYPHSLVITVQERVPIAVTAVPHERRLLVIGEGGVIVQQTTEINPQVLAVFGADLTGADLGSYFVDNRVTSTLEYIYKKDFEDGILRRIDFSDPTRVTLQSEGDVTIMLGALDGIEVRIDAAAALLDTIDLAKYRSIDLRFGGEAILVPR